MTNPSDANTFISRLRTELLQRQSINPAYSLRAFARKLGVSPGNLSGYLSENKRMSQDTFERLSKLIGLSAEEHLTYAHDCQTYPAPLTLLQGLLNPIPEGYSDTRQIHQMILAKIESNFLVQHILQTVLYGLPGTGKSICAAEFIRGQAAQEYFNEGIIWLNFSAHPTLDWLASQLSSLLGIACGEDMSLEQRARLIHENLLDKRLLIVCDDVYEEQDIRRLGLASAHLLITSPHMATAVALSTRNTSTSLASLLVIEPLAELAAQNFLQSALPKDIARNSITTPILEHAKGQLRYLDMSVTLVKRALTLGGPSRVERTLAQALPSLQDILAFTTQICSAEARLTLQMLCFFAPFPAQFQEEDALVLLNISPQHLDELLDAGLLRSFGDGWLFMPKPVHAAARNPELKDAQLEFTQALLQRALAIPNEEHWALQSIPHLQLGCLFMCETMEQAELQGDHLPQTSIAQVLASLIHQLRALGKEWGLIRDTIAFLEKASRHASSPRSQIHLNVAIFDLAFRIQDAEIMYGALNQQRRATSKWKNATIHEQQATQAQLLYDESTWWQFKLDINQEEKFLREALSLAQEPNLLRVQILVGLSAKQLIRRNIEIAASMLQEAEALARSLQLRNYHVLCLQNLAHALEWLGQAEQAESLRMQALRIAGTSKIVIPLYRDLARASLVFGKAEEAVNFLEQSIQLSSEQNTPKWFWEIELTKAMILLHQCRYIELIAAAQKIIDRNAYAYTSYGAHLLLARAYLAEGKLDYFQPIIGMLKTRFAEIVDFEVIFLDARALMLQERWQEAENLLRSIVGTFHSSERSDQAFEWHWLLCLTAKHQDRLVDYQELLGELESWTTRNLNQRWRSILNKQTL